jgi:hypothetical protein
MVEENGKSLEDSAHDLVLAVAFRFAAPQESTSFSWDLMQRCPDTTETVLSFRNLR